MRPREFRMVLDLEGRGAGLGRVGDDENSKF